MKGKNSTMAKHVKKFTCAGLEEYLSEIRTLLSLADDDRTSRLVTLEGRLSQDLKRMKTYAEFYKSRRELADNPQFQP
jgi:hypothetical protein